MFDFGLSYSHMLVIVILAVIVIGPKDLPVVLRRVGQFMNKVRGMGREFQGHVDSAMREAGMDDIKKDFQNLKSGIDADMKMPPDLSKSPSPMVSTAAHNDFNRFFGAETPGGETRVAGRGLVEPAA